MPSAKEQALIKEQELCHTGSCGDAFAVALEKLRRLITFHLGDDTISTVFVSYAHPAFNETDSRIKEMAEKEAWTRKAIHLLAQDLSHCGFKVLLDRNDSQVGGNPTKFMHQAIESADSILMVCTGLYNLKCTLSTKEHPYYVAYEVSKAIARHINNPQQKIIKPIMLSGTYQQSCQFLREMLPPEHAITTEELVLNGFAEEIQQSYIESLMRIIVQLLPEEKRSIIKPEISLIWKEFVSHGDYHASVYQGLHKQDKSNIEDSKIWPLIGNHHPQLTQPQFVGRNAELDLLYNHLNFPPQSRGNSVVISGLGGMGKTQLAKKYRTQFQSHYRMIFWLNSESKEQLLNGFRTIAMQLNESGLISEPINVGWGPSSELVERVKAELNKQEYCLLIFDNVEEVDLLSHFLPSNTKNHVLITTRNQHILSTSILKLGTLEEDAAVRILWHYSKKNSAASLTSTDEENFKNLAKHLGYLPLALVQAGSMLAKGYTASEYLTIFKKNHSKIVKSQHDLIKSREYSHSLLTVWQMNWEALSAKATECLTISAFLAAENQPKQLFEHYSGEDLDYILSELQQHSLLNFIEFENKTFIECHRLIQLMVLDNISQDDKNNVLTKLINVMAELCESTDEEREHNDLMSSRRRRFMLLSHWDNLSHYRDIIQDSRTLFTLLHKLASTKHERGDCVSALKYYDLAIAEAEKAFGRDDLQTISVRVELGGLYRDLRRAHDGMILYQELLHQLEIIDENTLELELKLKTGLACTLCDLNRHEQALPIFQDLIAQYTNLYGDHHRRVIINKYNLGSTYWELSQTDKAIETLTSLLKEVPEDDLLLSAGVRNSLAMVHMNKNRNEHFKAAEKLLKKSLKARIKHYSKNHSEVRAVYANLATLYWLQGDNKKAEKYYKRSITEKNSPNLLPYCVYLMSNGKWQKASTYLHRLMKISASSTYSCNQECSYRLKDQELLTVMFQMNACVVSLKYPLFAHYLLINCQFHQWLNVNQTVEEFSQKANDDGSKPAKLLANQVRHTLFSNRNTTSLNNISERITHRPPEFRIFEAQ